MSSAGLGPYAPWGLDLAGTDGQAQPGDDFFRFVNGTWLDRTPIPAEHSSIGIDQQITNEVQRTVRAILTDSEDAPEPDLAKARELYRSFLDEADLEVLGARPLRPALAAIQGCATADDVAALMGGAKRGLGASIFTLSIRPDAKDPDRYSVSIGQGGLGLPDRSSYLDADFASVRAEYRAYLARLLDLVGWEMPDEAAAAVLAFETALARASWPASAARDFARTYNPAAVADLVRASRFPWRRFLDAAGLGHVTVAVLAQPSAVRRIADLASEEPVATLRAWLAARLVDDAAPCLSSEFVRAHQAFRSGVLTGTLDSVPRWRRGIALVETLMGEAVGRAYVARAVPAGLKADVEAMVELLRRAFAVRIERVGWMSATAKARAEAKLARMGRKIAYPERWRSYAGLSVQRGDLLGNVVAARAWEWDRRLGRLGRAVERDEWVMTPQTADAAYSVSLNEIVLPAAELQPPFFHRAADPAVNFGAVGAIIGHEMTHGFDDDGRRFDAEGRLSDGWSPDDHEGFDREANRLAAQLDRTAVLPGVSVDGRLTLNEAIADLGGASIAFEAYRLSLAGRLPPLLDGLTGDQRFFMAFAQAWRWKERDTALRARLSSDPHPPPAVRVNGTVRNMDAWYEAFGVGPAHALYLEPSARVRLW